MGLKPSSQDLKAKNTSPYPPSLLKTT